MTAHYLSLNGFAQRAGLSRTTLVSYRHQGRLPEPDAIIGGPERGGTHGWLPETVDHWMENRVGQGHRTDLERHQKQATAEACS